MSRSLFLGAVVLGVAVSWILLLPQAPAAQPFPFTHARHAAVACVTCHAGVETAARASIPARSVCAKCHATAPAGFSASGWEQLGRDREASWVQVTRLPSHVMFSHRRHVVLGQLQCVSCHADVGTRATPPGLGPVRLDMDTCLSCHRREGASEDCASCHR